jgi:hypothetical protein
MYCREDPNVLERCAVGRDRPVVNGQFGPRNAEIAHVHSGIRRFHKGVVVGNAVPFEVGQPPSRYTLTYTYTLSG